MFQGLTIITTFTGLFTLLDMLVEKNAKVKIAEYVFGFGNVDLAGFENNLIKTLLNIFKNNGRLSLIKILLFYSGTISLLIFLISGGYLVVLSEDSVSVTVLEYISKNATLFAILPFFFLPFDYWSLWVTNRIFSGKKSSSLTHFFSRVFADLVVSITPIVVIFILAMFAIMTFEEGIVNESIFNPLSSIFISSVGNIFSSLLITIIQLSTLAVGVMIRLVLRMAKLNQHLAMVSSAHEFPFTFIGLLTGVMVAIVSGFLL